MRCERGRSVEYPPGFLQRRRRVPSDTLVFDLQFRLRCSHCNARMGFRITIFDERTRGDNWKPRLEPGGCGGGVRGRRVGSEARWRSLVCSDHHRVLAEILIQRFRFSASSTPDRLELISDWFCCRL